MRAERLPDLLNNLSGRKDAKVRVKFISPDNEEIEVTRRIKVKEDLTYTSSYLLNGKGATLTEIHDRLGRHNVSPTGFNVIMQGDVTGIVTMSATERRKIIDELAGVADFDRRIDQAQSELTSVAEKIDHQRIVLTEIIARLEVLRSDRDQALKYLDLKTKKETIERDLIFVRALELEERVKHELAEIERLEGKESELADKLHQTEVNLLSLRAEMGRIDEEIKDKGGNEQLLLRQELENKRGELTREENKLSNLQGAIGEKEKTLKNLNEQVKVIEKNLNKLAKQKKQHIEDQKAVQLVLMERQGAYSAVMAEIEVYRQEKDKSSEKVSTLHTDLQALREENHKLSLKKTELETRRQGLEKELEGLRAQATEKITRSASLKNAMGFIHKKFVDQEALVLGIDRSIEQLEAELDSTNEEIESKTHGLQTVQKRIIELETHKEVAGESGYGRAVESILGANIRGVHGTIGQLGSVDEEYQTALETCIGGRLSHIVVEDDQVAQECINYLKDNNAGRATFIPLNKIAVQPPGLLPSRPGVIDFAYNLVDFDQRFTKAFQYACGSTIVVDDINNARKMITQARMATLTGELFEKAGSITGGKEKNKLHFSSKGETDLGVLKQTAKNLADQLKWLKDSVKDLTQQLSEERKKQNQERVELAKRKAEIDTQRQNSDDLDLSIETIKPQLRSKGDEIDAIDQEMVSLEEGAKEMSSRIASLEQSLDGIRDKGKQTELERLITESEECRQDLNIVESEFNDFQKSIDRIETEETLEGNNLDGLVKQAEAVKQEIEEVSVQKPIYEANMAALNESIAEMEQKVSQISVELESLREKKDKIHEDVTAQEVAKTKLDQEVIRIIEQRKQHQMAHFDVTRELASVKQEIATVLETNPNYEPPNSKTVEELKKECERLEKRMRALEPVNMKALEDYNTTETRKNELDENLDTLENEKLEINQRIDGYGELKKKTFMEAFDAINQNFQDIFAELSHGHGKLELEHPETPFEGGLVIRAQPRDKKMQRIEALSGGEKSLTALSFVFAFQRYAPAPFYAFDEVDMMLDGANAERLAQMVKRQSSTAQFVVVSLRRPMIENSDHAIGVSLRADGYSRVVGIQEIKIPDQPEVQAVGA